MAGKWAGTFEASGFSSRSISTEVIQVVDCVDAAWTTAPREWAGAISGFAGVQSFAGLLSIEGSGCSAVGALSGDVNGDTMTLTWSTTGPGAGNCAGVLPRSAVVNLRRQ